MPPVACERTRTAIRVGSRPKTRARLSRAKSNKQTFTQPVPEGAAEPTEVVPFSIGAYKAFEVTAELQFFSSQHDAFVRGGFIKLWDGMAQTQVIGPHRLPRLMIEAEIKAYKCSTFENFVEHDVHVVFAETALLPRLKQLDQPVSIFRLYTHTGGNIPLAIVEHNLHTRVNTALCRGKWISVKECMFMLKRRLTCTQYQPASEDDQRQWWAQNGKAFPLLDLAAELRNEIYRAAIGYHVWVPSTQERRQMRNARRPFDTTRHNFNLLGVSRQLYKEVSHVLYNKTQYEVTEAETLRDGSIGRFLHPQIRHLAVNWNFFTLLTKVCAVPEKGKEISDDRRRIVKHPSYVMQSMDLDTLQVIMPAPQTYIDDDHKEQPICQMKIVKWILLGLWQYARGHNVYITGWVKDWQKQDFEVSCDIERERFLEWREKRITARMDPGNAIQYAAECDLVDDEEDGGVRLDGKPKIPVVPKHHPILDWEDTEIPEDTSRPECECEVPCSIEEWTA